MHTLLEGGNLMTLSQPDGYDIAMVDVSISNFDYSIFLSSNCHENCAPFIWIKHKEKSYYERIFLLEQNQLDNLSPLYSWIDKNIDVLLSHWHGEITDKEALNLLYD